MNSLAESTLDAIELMYNNAVQNSKNSKTIECKVIEKLDAGLGLYRVSYLGNDNMEAYASNASINYEKDDVIYVLVPEGNDFSKTKIILGAASPSGNMYVTEEGSEYITISENLNNNDNDEVSLCTYKSEQLDPKQIENFKTKTFINYLSKYKNFAFSANIKTSIPTEQQANGNYGVILQLPIIRDEGDGYDEEGKETIVKDWLDIYIDVNNIKGNPYALTSYSLQTVHFQLPDDLVYDEDEERKPQLIYFVKGFAQDAKKTEKDIFIKDVSFVVEDVIPEESMSKYYLALVASQGNYFMPSSDETKTITPILKLNGKNTSLDNYKCYWFVEDASIGVNDEGYLPEGGIGWRCLNEKIEGETAEDGSIIYTVVTNNYSQTVSKEDVYTTLEYKCVLTKEGIDNIVKTIEFKNLKADRQLQVVTTTGSYSYMKDTGYVNLIARIKKKESATDIISLAWQRFDKDGNYLGNDFYTVVRSNDIVDGWIETEISFPCSYIKEKNLIKCTFYRDITKNGLPAQANLGTVDVLIVTTENKNYKVLFENGDVVYNYDADGDAPTGGNAYDGGARVEVIHPINFKIFKLDNTEFTEKEYQYCKVEWWIPQNSMIKVSQNDEREGYYIISGNGHFPLTYDIDKKFYATKNNNTIILKVYFKNDLIVEENTIKFIKDGQSGTNGTKYQAFITYNNKVYGEDGCKLQLIYINKQVPGIDTPTAGWNTLNTTTGAIEPFENKIMDIIVYKDNQQLILSQQDGITIEWDIYEADKVNPFLDINRSTGEISIRAKDGEYVKWEHSEQDPSGASDNHTTIIRAIVTIEEQGEDRDQIYNEVVYCYYPVECTYLVDNTISLVPNLTEGFDDVLYSRDGKTPKYNTQPFVYTPNFEVLTELVKAKYLWTVGNKNLKVSHFDPYIPTCEIKPATDFDGFNTNNYIKVKMYYENEEEINKAKQKLDEIKGIKAGEELFRDYLYKAGKDSVKQNLFDLFENFNYNKIGKGFTNNQFIATRSFAIKTAVNAIETLNNIYVFCSRYNLLDNPNVYSYKTDYLNLFSKIAGVSEVLEEKGEKEKLYELGYITELDDLDDLLSLSIDPDTLNKIRKFVSKTFVYNEFTRLIEDYNSIVQNYHNIIDNLTTVGNKPFDTKSEDKETVFKVFQDSVTTIIDYSNKEDLEWLRKHSQDYANRITLINYDNLKNTLDEITKSFYTPNVDINMTEVIDDKIVYNKEKYNDLSIRNIGTILNSYYRKLLEYCNSSENPEAPCFKGINNKIAEVNLEIERLSKEISDYNKFITDTTSFTGNNYIIHLKPIVMLYNRYELGFLNAWDGTKLEIGKNNQSLVAPQIGAGKKESNGFTGIVLGVDNKDEIGLFGFKEGAQSIFLDARTGTSKFGISGGGQIIMKPGEKAVIQSGNYNPYNRDEYVLIEYIKPQDNPKTLGLFEEDPTSSTGYKPTKDTSPQPNKEYYSCCNQSGMLIDFTTPEIKFGSGKFKVTSEGKIYAQGGGEIAGWKIGDNTLSSIETRTSGIELNSSNSSIHIIDVVGKIYSGTHSAIDSISDGFYLSNNGLSIGSKTYIGADGELRLGSGAVTNTGKHWKIGKETVPLATGGTENISVLKYGNKNESSSVYISTNEITLGTRFRVTSEGVLYLGAGAVDNNKDTHWTISDSAGNSYIAYRTDNKYFDTNNNIITIKNNTAKPTDNPPVNGARTDEVYIGTDGIRLGQKFAVDTSGNVLAKYLYANSGGKIGGWTIGSSSLTGESESGKANNKITISATGSITAPQWELRRDGYAEFKNVSIQGGNLTIGSNASIDSSGNAVFNNVIVTGTVNANGGYLGLAADGKTHLNSITSDGLAFNSGSVALSCSDGTYVGDKITFTKEGGLTIKGNLTARDGTFTGTVYANAGVIGGCSIADGELKVDSAHITSIDSNLIINGLATVNSVSVKRLGITEDSYGPGTLGVFSFGGHSVSRRSATIPEGEGTKTINYLSWD